MTKTIQVNREAHSVLAGRKAEAAKEGRSPSYSQVIIDLASVPTEVLQKALEIKEKEKAAEGKK